MRGGATLKKICFLIIFVALTISGQAKDKTGKIEMEKALSKEAIISVMFEPAKGDVSEQIQKRLKDEFGWVKKVVKKQLKDGIYTETQITEFSRGVAEDEIEKKVKKNIDKIKPVELDVVKIKTTEVIAKYLRYIKFAPSKEIKPVDLEITTVALKEVPIQDVKPADLGIISVALQEVAIADIEPLVIYIVDLISPRKVAGFDTADLRLALQNKNYSGVKTLLKKYGVPIDITDAIIKGIIPKQEMFFAINVMGENAYMIDKNYDRRVADGDIVIVDVSMMENRILFAEFVKRNKGGKRYAIQLGYGTMNNYDLPDEKYFPMMAKEFKDFYVLAKSIDSGVVVGITVCARPNAHEWIKAMEKEGVMSDVLFLWNLFKTGFSVEAVKRQYGENIVIAGMAILRTEGAIPNPAWYVKKIRDSKFLGSIWIK